ncbi:cytochrome c family protein [Lutibacter sp.]|uniref:c-type cytochrome n=1 Tax=Lutibacter sp. TaxID=1925666 RepID=UPI00273446F7|nr:cytochrome c [Lutibacter sp.]MDP3313640.1 cytochrome c [Lutibacter sp.]
MKLKLVVLSAVVALVMSCGNDGKKDGTQQTEENKEAAVVDPMQDKGIGPVTSITLGEIDDALVVEGQKLFEVKCTACHKIGKRFVGPDLTGITGRRTSEWIMNMILNPDEMVQKNEAAKKLLAEYLSPMANQSLTEPEARAILEYFRTLKVE